jgi:hypothetical protein
MLSGKTKTIIVITLVFLLAVSAQGLVNPGRITIYSTPSGAQACIDGTTCDTTPATFPVDGNAWHTVTITASGFLQWSDSLYVVSDQTSVVNAVLDQNPSTTGIQVYVTPGGGTVCLDYSQCTQNVGSAGTTGSTQFTGMSAGYHTISVNSLAGYQDYSTSVYVNAGSFTTVTINLLTSTVTPTVTTTSSFRPTGTIRVYVDRVGSTICIDNGDCRVNVGGTSGPGTSTTLFNNVDPNIIHAVSVSEDGYATKSVQVSVAKDSISTVNVQLVPLSALTTAPTPVPPLTTLPTVTATTAPTLPIIPQSTRAGLDMIPVLGALGICGAVMMCRNNRK